MEEEILQSSSHRVPAYFCILQFCFLCSAVKLWPCDAAAGRSHQANTRFFRRNSHRPCREPPPHSPDIPTELCSLQYSVVLLTFIQKHTDRHAHMLVQMSIFFLNVCFSSSSLFLGFSVPLFCVHGGVLFPPSSFFFLHENVHILYILLFKVFVTQTLVCVFMDPGEVSDTACC